MLTPLNDAFLRDDVDFVIGRIRLGCHPLAMVYKALNANAYSTLSTLVQKYYWLLPATLWLRLSKVECLHLPHDVVHRIHAHAVTSSHPREWLRSLLSWQSKGVVFPVETVASFWRQDHFDSYIVRHAMIEWLVQGKIDLVECATRELALNWTNKELVVSTHQINKNMYDDTMIADGWRECLIAGALEGLRWCQTFDVSRFWLIWLSRLCQQLYFKFSGTLRRKIDVACAIRNIVDLLIPNVVATPNIFWSYIALLPTKSKKKSMVDTFSLITLPAGWDRWLTEEVLPEGDNWAITVQWIVQTTPSLEQRIVLLEQTLLGVDDAWESVF